MKLFLFVFFNIILIGESLSATFPKLGVEENNNKNQFWTLGASLNNMSFKAGDGYELIGNSGIISIGYGYIKDRWYVVAAGDYILGPFYLNHGYFRLDYEGTGASVWWGYSAQKLDLRHPQGGYGFTIGFNYLDTVGRNLYRQKERFVPRYYSEVGMTSDEGVRVTVGSISPGIFFCWMEEARTFGSSFEQLKTRIEGYVLTLAFQIPIFSRYKYSYSQWVLKDESTSLEGKDLSEDFYIPFEEWNMDLVRQKGRLKGMTIFISIQSLFGV